MDSKDYIRVLLYSYYTTITGWGGSPNLYISVSLKIEFEPVESLLLLLSCCCEALTAKYYKACEV